MNYVLYAPTGLVYPADVFKNDILQSISSRLIISRKFAAQFDPVTGTTYVGEQMGLTLAVRFITANAMRPEPNEARMPYTLHGENDTWSMQFSSDPTVDNDEDGEQQAEQQDSDFQMHVHVHMAHFEGVTFEPVPLNNEHPLVAMMVRDEPYGMNFGLINSEFPIIEAMGKKPGSSKVEKIKVRLNPREDLTRLTKRMQHVQRLTAELNQAQNLMLKTDPGISDPLRDNAIQLIEENEATADQGGPSIIADNEKIEATRQEIEKTKKTVVNLVSRYGHVEGEFNLVEVNRPDVATLVRTILEGSPESGWSDSKYGGNLMRFFREKIIKATAAVILED